MRPRQRAVGQRKLEKPDIIHALDGAHGSDVVEGRPGHVVRLPGFVPCVEHAGLAGAKRDLLAHAQKEVGAGRGVGQGDAYVCLAETGIAGKRICAICCGRWIPALRVVTSRCALLLGCADDFADEQIGVRLHHRVLDLATNGKLNRIIARKSVNARTIPSPFTGAVTGHDVTDREDPDAVGAIGLGGSGEDQTSAGGEGE